MTTTYFGRSQGRQTIIKSVGGAIKVRFTDPVQAIRYFDSISAALKDLQEPLEEYGRYIVEEHIPRQFEAQGFPQRWPSLKTEYRKWKEKHYPGKPILVRTGRMKAGFSYQVTKRTLRVVNRVTAGQRNRTPRWSWHQEPSEDSPLRARPMLQTTEKDLVILSEHVFDHLEQAGEL